MDSISHMITQWRTHNQLLYVTIVLQKKGRRSFYGRILSFDSELETVLFYCDDRSATEFVSLRDIDNIEPAQFII